MTSTLVFSHQYGTSSCVHTTIKVVVLILESKLSSLLSFSQLLGAVGQFFFSSSAKMTLTGFL